MTVIIPARNEEKNILHVLRGIPDWVYEVILVDGCSVDQTVRVAKEHFENIRAVAQPGRGKGDALREGFRHSTGDFIVAIDADGSMDPAEMELFVAKMEAGYDMVKGSRCLPGGGSADITLLRRFGNWAFCTAANLLFGSQYTDLCYGYFAFRRGTIDAIGLKSDGFEIETEIAIEAQRAGLRIAEVPSFEEERLNGVSNLNTLRDGWRILKTLVSARFRRARVELEPVQLVPVAERIRDPE